MTAATTKLGRVLPTRTELVPWTDRRGRPNRLRATTLAMLLLPALSLAVQALLHQLGAEPVKAALHSTGYWTIWLLLASLAVTPFKALAGQPNIVVIRRMVGNAALLYAALHLVLYVADENWRLLLVASEILKRFYLTIGFVALMGLFVLGLTSTDGWARELGRGWKRLHRLIYGLLALGLVHYVLQSKLDVSQAILASGVFAWLLLWRLMPAGRDREWPSLLAMSVVAAVLTLGIEYAWYRFGTRINPMKVLANELDPTYGLHPAGQVLLLGVAATAATELRRLSISAFGAGRLFTMLAYALGALAGGAVATFNGWSYDDIIPDGTSPWLLDGAWFVLLGLLGLARWRLREHWLRRAFDGLWLACVLYQVVLVGSGSPMVGGALAVVAAVAALLVAARTWAMSREAAVMLAPLCLFLAYRAASLL